MNHTDPIADMLTRIRNANVVRKDHVDIPSSRIKVSIARILKEEGYVKYYKTMRNNQHGVIRIFMKYGPLRDPVIHGIERVSSPGLRKYVGSDDIPRVRGGFGVAIISTSQGILTGNECRRRNVGGELLAVIW